MYEINTGFSPEERRQPPVRRQSANTAVTALLCVVVGLQVFTLIFMAVWEARYQRAVDAVERAVQSLEAIEL